ncbi:DUF1764-domain-containing protein [Pisolithus tinctorius]|nr:DUF1764-domain-containing protein [Pisolithus tinctorius]
MPASSEIDEIFAAKPQATASKTKKKAKQSSSKRSNPETVVDSSSTQRPQHDDDRFKDSRGTGSRQKTEEGYNIYKEDELGIGNEGGDTPLCPFDCNCCMFHFSRQPDKYSPVTGF